VSYRGTQNGRWGSWGKPEHLKQILYKDKDEDRENGGKRLSTACVWEEKGRMR
jgi:hypothetical protein